MTAQVPFSVRNPIVCGLGGIEVVFAKHKKNLLFMHEVDGVVRLFFGVMSLHGRGGRCGSAPRRLRSKFLCAGIDDVGPFYK